MLPATLHNILFACVCVAISVFLECTLFQYNHYGVFGSDETISTVDSNTEWTTLRFGDLTVGSENAYKQTYYFSLANVLDGADNPKETAAYIEDTLQMPENAIDKEYEEQQENYESKVGNSGLDPVYPKIVEYDDELAVISFPGLNNKFHQFISCHFGFLRTIK